MRVLFVSAGTRAGVPAEVVKNQGEALIQQGVDLRHFCVGRGGLWGYASALPRLRKEIKMFRPDVVHAHYSLSGFLAAISGAKPLLVSIMGSEPNGGLIHRLLIRLFIKYFWTETIVKTSAMAQKLKLDESHVVPNGVNISRFKPIDQAEAMAKTQFEKGTKNIIFVSNPARPEKNWTLAEKAVALMDDPEVKLTAVCDKSNSELVYFYNSASVLLLTSMWEGSPNVIKEAMACNCPIVATDVGDIRFLCGDTKGTYITSFNCNDITARLKDAVRYSEENGRTNGREHILRNGLDSVSVSEKLEGIYERIIKREDKKG
jgi:teichuronic acid biosynthesis glycosyltransferase TuaC